MNLLLVIASLREAIHRVCNPTQSIATLVRLARNDDWNLLRFYMFWRCDFSRTHQYMRLKPHLHFDIIARILYWKLAMQPNTNENNGVAKKSQ
ncbi:MAG: hypothetical protein K2N12_06525 [Helicobacter sp.]|nr:hypothetical protein [Helicobacter sp.]